MRPVRPRQPFDLVEVWWDDASELDSGWTDEVEEVSPHMVLSVGFLIKKTRAHLVIAMDIDAEEQHNGRSQIPMGMVKRLEVLRKRDR